MWWMSCLHNLWHSTNPNKMPLCSSRWRALHFAQLGTEAKMPSYILVAATEWKTRQLLQCSDGNLASVLPLPSQLRASAQGFHLLWYGGRLTIEHVLAKLGKMEWSLIIKAVCDAIKMEHFLTAQEFSPVLILKKKNKIKNKNWGVP